MHKKFTNFLLVFWHKYQLLTIEKPTHKSTVQDESFENTMICIIKVQNAMICQGKCAQYSTVQKTKNGQLMFWHRHPILSQQVASTMRRAKLVLFAMPRDGEET